MTTPEREPKIKPVARAVSRGVALTAQVLTSPPMSGEAVRQTQVLLRHNAFGIFEPGTVEGAYDEQTAAAVRRAKYWLGYPESRIDETCDDELRGLLAGERPLPPAWQETRESRLRRAERGLFWERAYQVAVEQLGRREDPPGSRRTPYTLWYGVLAPWGVIFASFCYAQAGSYAFRPGDRYAYAPYLLGDARRSRNSLSITQDPLRGDLALVDEDGDGAPDRVAVFDSWEDEPRQAFIAIEGDIGYEGETAGEGSVARSKRAAPDTLAFVHVRG